VSARPALGLMLALGIVGAPFALAMASSLGVSSQNLTPYRTCTITATPAATTVVRDASVRQGLPNTNFGATTTSNVASGNGLNRRLYVRFDLTVCAPAIPSTATVRLATLRAYLTGVPAVCRTIDIFPVTAAWTETAITWNNQPFGTAINNPPSGSRTGFFSVGTPIGCQNRVTGAYLVGAIVTSDVAAQVAGSATNFGWMLRDDVEGSGTTRTVTVSAKELGAVAQAPQLVVTYVEQP